MSNNLALVTPDTDVIVLWKKMLELSTLAGEISPTTSATYKRGLDHFTKWNQVHQADAVNGDTIREWIAGLREGGAKPSSINTWYAGVRRFYAWALEKELVAVNPAAAVKGVKRHGTNKRHLRDALTDTEILRVLKQPDTTAAQGKRDLAWLSLMAYCALRTIEVNRADLADLSTVDGFPVLRVQGKGSSEKDDFTVIASEHAQTALYDWLGIRGNKPGALFTSLSNRNRGDRLGLSAFRHLGELYFTRAGVVDGRKTLHSLRHSAISKVAKKDILKAKQVARHESLDTTMIYVHQGNRLDDPGEAYITYTNGA